MIEQRAAELERQLDAQRTSGSSSGGRGQLVVQFFEKRRRKAWLSRGDEEVCWECWTVKVTVAEPRTESGAFLFYLTPVKGDVYEANMRRTSQGPARHGTNPPDNRHQDRHLLQRPQGPHPPHHRAGHQPVSLQDHARPEGDGELGVADAYLLGFTKERDI
jgi:hypothetical protein